MLDKDKNSTGANAPSYFNLPIAMKKKYSTDRWSTYNNYVIRVIENFVTSSSEFQKKFVRIL